MAKLVEMFYFTFNFYKNLISQEYLGRFLFRFFLDFLHLILLTLVHSYALMFLYNVYSPTK